MIEYVDSRLPGEQAINKLYRNDKSIDGKADQGIFDINEIDNIYDRIGNRIYERNVELGNTLANYSNWGNIKEESGYGIWKYPVSSFTDDDLNELYINNVKLDYVGQADSEDTPVGFTKVYTSNNKKSGPTYTDVTTESGTLAGTPFTIGGVTEYTINVTPTTSGVALDYNNIVIGSVRVVTLASAPVYISYVENTDYEIDYVVGTITLLSGTSITGMVEMTYSVGDALYIGLSTTFDSYSVGLAQRGVGNRFRPTYYKTGTGWEYFQPDIDTTSGFASDGNFTFSGLTGWGTTAVNSQTLYWIKLDTLSQPLVYPTCNYIVESSSSVSKLLKLNMVDILQANYKWSYFSGYIYVNIPNNGASNQEGIGYLKSASSDDNKRNYFIYNNVYKTNYRNTTTETGLKIPSLADSAASNSTLYYSTTASKLVFKDSGGTVRALW